ncbi:MAG TPA: hypothetical protein VLT33_37735, partial [Labilithrix sp.]|nr:hypothetical protein [Labilithrix sp.]
AVAQTLFDQARKLMIQERWKEACPKLEESQRLDPAGGTLLHLALCREREGRIATAWALYTDAFAQAKRDGRADRTKIAHERIEALAPKLPRLRIRVAAANRSTPGFTLTRDDREIGAATWDEAFPVDPGTITLLARAPGKKSLSTLVDVPSRPGEMLVDIPALTNEESAHGELTPKVTEPPLVPRETPPADGSTQRTMAYVVGGAGIAGLAVGSVFGVLSMSKRSDAKAECQPPEYKLCTAAGVAAGDAAVQRGNVSTVAFIVGGALVAGGVALYFTAPKASAVALAPSVGPGEASLGLSGRFW